ncbi:unnamed protein product [Clonostachys solani]|uniref:Uncharacterized protein n=1 Tax=Clonostachys solani TaxID=160281 RepID=A0A9P0EJ07_9HYPO|nr:unnamed protein product [Clonostachys solani]
MVRGHINTDDHDGRPLQILFMIKDKNHQEDVIKNLSAYVEVLRTFVTRWNNGHEGFKPYYCCFTV